MATEKKVITANTLDEVKRLQQDMVNQGWHSERGPYQNDNGTYSVDMSRNDTASNSATKQESTF